MNKLKILITLIVCIALMSCANKKDQKDLAIHATAQECIDYVIALDDSLGTIRNHACEKQSLSETIDEYVYNLDNLSFSNCPPAFITAFDEHKDAWVNATEITDNYPDLRGEMHELFEIIENGPDSIAFKLLVAEIWSTWEQVELATNLE